MGIPELGESRIHGQERKRETVWEKGRGLLVTVRRLRAEHYISSIVTKAHTIRGRADDYMADVRQGNLGIKVSDDNRVNVNLTTEYPNKSFTFDAVSETGDAYHLISLRIGDETNGWTPSLTHQRLGYLTFRGQQDFFQPVIEALDEAMRSPQAGTLDA